MLKDKYGKIIFLHIPRTGGISFRTLMHEVYGYDNIGRNWWGHHFGETLSREEQMKSAFYGHFSFGIHKMISFPTSYITILREPAERLVSEYLRNNYKKRYGWSPREFAARVEESSFGWDKAGDNLQVRMISGAGAGSVISESHVARAIGNIRENFAFVGFTHQYDRLMKFVREELDWNFKEEIHKNQGPGGEVSQSELDDLKSCPELKYDYMLWNALKGRRRC